MNILDIRTVLFSSSITSAICAMVMNSLWRQNRKRSPELAFWLADFILQFAATLLIALRGIIPDVVSILFGVPFSLLGALLMLIGLERYLGKTSTQRYNFVLLAVFTLVHGYFIYAQPSLPARNINFSLGLLVFCGQCAWFLLHRMDTEMRPYTRAVGVVFTAYGLVSLIRIFVDLAMPHTNDLFKSGLNDTLAILIYQILLISLIFTLFLMVNRRLFSDLENDIAKRKLAEAALKKSEEKFSVAFHNIPDAILITSLMDGKIIEANESLFRITGFSTEESIGKTTLELNLWGNLADRERLVGQINKYGQVLNFETRFRKKSGELFTGWVSSELIQLQGLACILNVIQDVTDLQQAQEEIQRLSRFPAENPNPVLRIERNGRILYANPSSAPILAAWGREVGQEVPDDWRAQIASVFEAGENREVELDWQNQVFSCFLTPILEEGYINLYGRDITERKQASDKLRESERKLKEVNSDLKQAQSVARLGNWKWDLKTSTVEWSDEMFNIFGIDKDAYTGRLGGVIAKVIHPDDLYIVLPENAAEFAGNKPQEYRIIRPKDGEIRHIWAQAGESILNEQGNPAFLTGIAQDITERKRMEEVLKENARAKTEFLEKLNEAQHLAMVGSWEWDLTTNQVWWSEETYRIFGVTPQDFVPSFEANGKFIHPDDFEKYSQAFEHSLQTGASLALDLRLVSGDGVLKHCHAMGKVIYNDAGQALRFTGTIMDITERKQAEEIQRQSELLFRTLFELSPDAVIILDPNDPKISSPIVDCNAAACLMNGYQRDELIGQSIDIVNADPYTPGGQTAYLEKLRAEGHLKLEVFHRHKNGFIFPVEVSTAIIKVGERELVIGIDRDITERKRAEQELTAYSERLEEMVGERTRELRAAQEQLVRQERLATLGQLAGSIGHELRNPLGVISNAIYYLKMSQPEASDKVQEYLEIIEKETRASDKIVTDLLDFTRVKSVDRESASISELVDKALERYPVPPPVQVTLKISPDLPNIYADPQQVTQVLGNLITNASQAMTGARSIKQTKLTISAAAQGDMMLIAVRDTGPGIPHENMDKLFQPLFTTKSKGIGLGLAVSKKLVEANGGRIEVESVVDQGCTFTVYLPVYKE